jgi:hypothetical protein
MFTHYKSHVFIVTGKQIFKESKNHQLPPSVLKISNVFMDKRKIKILEVHIACPFFDWAQ